MTSFIETLVDCEKCGDRFYSFYHEFQTCGKCRTRNNVSTITTIKKIVPKWNCYFCEKNIPNAKPNMCKDKICCTTCFEDYIKIHANKYEKHEIDSGFLLRVIYQLSCITCDKHKTSQLVQNDNQRKMLYEYGTTDVVYSETAQMHHDSRSVDYSIPLNFEITPKIWRLVELGESFSPCGCVTIFTVRTIRKVKNNQ